ncbi:MAG: hypothetical protein LBH40_02315 [Alphaproteobacteria bacterium]|jgi:hypothetical protein|nr:hypothetical protein [Alphaproteobacteria bacterium]
MVKKIIFIGFLVGILYGKAFSYELIGSVGYLQSKYKETQTNSSSPTISVDVYAPVLFDGFSVGMGLGYFETNLGSSTALAQQFRDDLNVDERDIHLALFPTYLGAKYEYFFNKNFSTFISGKAGITIGDKRFYDGTISLVDDEGPYEISSNLEVWGNRIYGGTLGFSFYRNYLFSVSYDSAYIKSIYSMNKLGRFTNLTRIDTISVKFSYAFRSR